MRNAFDRPVVEIAVGDSGVILNSPNGLADAWTDVSTVNAPQSLKGVTWDGNQFVVVGSNDTILTSPDGIAWTSHIPGLLISILSLSLSGILQSHQIRFWARWVQRGRLLLAPMPIQA